MLELPLDLDDEVFLVLFGNFEFELLQEVVFLLFYLFGFHGGDVLELFVDLDHFRANVLEVLVVLLLEAGSVDYGRSLEDGGVSIRCGFQGFVEVSL